MKAVGYREDELKEPFELVEEPYKYNAEKFREKDFTMKTVIDDLKNHSKTPLDLHSYGFKATEMIQAGYEIHQLVGPR